MKILDLLDQILTAVSAAALVLLMAMISISVIGRYFFNSPVPDDVLLGQVLMLPIVLLPMAAGQARREHIFVALFTDRAPRRIRTGLEVFGMLLGAVLFGIIAWASYAALAHSIRSRAYIIGVLDLPEYPGRLVVFLATALFSLRLAVDAVRVMAGRSIAGLSQDEMDAAQHQPE
ncbi:MAG: TRAP transporter small permease [Sagittula sp.]|uniref:TRAP transporter small permease n=1 Tax=Sagittula sp. TaxID=2038081 RepID=UPI004059142A